MNLWFLSAQIPLTKTYSHNEHGELVKSSYPNVKAMTTHKEVVSSLEEFKSALIAHAAKGHCLLKGEASRELNLQSRAGLTDPQQHTQWICIDLDFVQCKTPVEFLKQHDTLKDVSCVVQYSASYGIDGNAALKAHLFFMLDAPVQPEVLKSWLMSLNLHVAENRRAIQLTESQKFLRWPVDITTCQNDKLLYIAPPVLEKGVHCAISTTERIQLITGKLQTLPVKRISTQAQKEQIQQEVAELRNALRKESGLPTIRTAVKHIKGCEIQPRPGTATITGTKEERGFVYFNLNGGDSWGYYHPADQFELIHNFKGEPSYYTKELLPDYYNARTRAQTEAMGQPTEDGMVVLAFRDKRTAQYWNGTWNPTTQNLELYPARSELQLSHWMQNHGLMPYEIIPVWDMYFNPQTQVILDEENKRINTFVLSDALKKEYQQPASLTDCPTISRIIRHAVSRGEQNGTLEHFLNWLAVIFQQRRKTRCAWVLHGTEGTGKGLLVSKILRPLLGEKYVMTRRASELEEVWTGWLDQALIAFIDEINMDASGKKEFISSNLKNFITEETVTLRSMNRMSVETRNYTNFIFSSNRGAMILIDEANRRYNFGYAQMTPLQITTEEVEKRIPEELPAFMAYIMTRSADATRAGQVVKNDALMRVVEANKTSIDMLVKYLLEGDLMQLWESRPDSSLLIEVYGQNSMIAMAFSNLMAREIEAMRLEGKERKRLDGKTVVWMSTRFSREELMVVFEHCIGGMPKTPNKFTSMMAHRGIQLQRLRTEKGVKAGTGYGLKLEWEVEKSWLMERVAEMQLEHSANTKARKLTTKQGRQS